MMGFMVVMPPDTSKDKNPPHSQIDPSQFQVSTLQMDFSKVHNVDKISVSKRTNEVVYTSLLKVEREKDKLEKQIEKLQADLDNKKSRRKAADSKCNDLQKRIKNSGSAVEIAEQEKKDAELKDLTEKLAKSSKKIVEEKASFQKLYKSYESAAAEMRKLQDLLDHGKKKEKHLQEEVEEERKKMCTNERRPAQCK